MAPAKKTRSLSRRLLTVAGVAVIALVVLAPTAFAAYYRDRIVPGVTVNGIALGGLTREEAATRLQVAVDTVKNAGIPVTDGQKTVRMESLIGWDVAGAVERAYAIGHRGKVLTRIGESADALFSGERVRLAPTFEGTAIRAKLREVFSPGEIPATDARLVIAMNANRLGEVTVEPESPGRSFDYEAAAQALEREIQTLEIVPITLREIALVPEVSATFAEASAAHVASALALAPLTLAAEDKKWTLTAALLAPLLEPVAAPGGPTLRLNETATLDHLASLAAGFDIPSSDTKLEIDPATKKVTEFVQGRDGRRIHAAKALAALDALLADELAGTPAPDRLILPTEELKSRVVTKTAAELGIREVIGIGRSNFRGSTGKRIHNIRHGSGKLNGRLIAPGEVFSTVTELEPVTEADGYVPEQIILGNRITPGVGGGLCQIGTTTFRAAMNAGLPIVERFNHGLVVRYYNDPQNGNPGTDATLYGPHPDLRFLNDTGNWILFTADVDIQSNDLIYSFWGTPDGRNGYYTPPKVIRWIAAPAETIEIESTDVAPGERKCQKPFVGADTTFTYIIERTDGSKTEREFPSHYRALPEICLVNSSTPTPPPPAIELPPETVLNN